MPDDETPVDDEAAAPVEAEAAPDEAEAPDAVPTIAAEHEPLLETLRSELGDGVLDAVSNHDSLVVRVANASWHAAAEAARSRLGYDYLSFVSAIDWEPRPMPPTEDPAAPSFPAQPTEVTYGVAGSAGRFQVFAVVESTEAPTSVVLKTDVDAGDPRVASWTDVFPGADWHERECHEMFGIGFDGHPDPRKLYLPNEFEGYPLRKDFPLLAREVKPWPGLVDVEAMPGDAQGDDDATAAAGGEDA
jgi:NADH-quinone oxidoreductase subunit C